MKNSANRRTLITEIAVFVFLVSLGAGLRIGLQDLPNFAPVAAMSLFAGYFFRRIFIAACVPMAVMLISDQFIGSYDWYMMAMVYGMLVMPVLMRSPLRKLFRVKRGRIASSLTSFAGLFVCGLFSSILFFLVTNLGSWLWFPMYERSLAGLLQCYTQGTPFFRHRLW